MRMIGRYRVRGLLGRGGMSTVYKVSMPVLDKIVALKLLAPADALQEVIGNQDLIRLFTAEALTMAGLRHTNIVDIRDFDTDEKGMPFYIMEYYCNNLGRLIGEHYRIEELSRILAPEKVFHYGKQILDGLGSLHQAGIVHRDIKPYNILLTDQDTVKICDFGLSRVRGEIFPASNHLNVGSPYYAAPEQVADPEDADQRADLYSTGVMLYRMVTGQLPEESRKPCKTNTLLDESWDVFFESALAPDKKNRFGNADAMHQTLVELEQHWLKQKELTCNYVDPHSPNKKTQPEAAPQTGLRSVAEHFPVAAARKDLGLDQLWRPMLPSTNNFIKQIDNTGNTTILDRDTNLLWQQGGSSYPLTWPAAQDYINELNSTQYAGRTDWRLPTVPEIISLIQEKSAPTDYCIDSLFDLRQKALWSCDRRSKLAAWYVNVDLGFVAWQDLTCFFYIKAVCSHTV